MPRSLSILSRTRRWWASTIFVACAALLLPVPAAAQTVPMDQAALVKDLSGRDWLKRFDAASAILGIPAAHRDKTTIAAVVREIQRLQKLKEHGVEELPASVKDRNAAQTYYGNLLDIASESSDPVAIPVLIQAAHDQRDVVDALARYGETAVPQLLAAAQSSAKPGAAAGAISTFGVMLETQIPLAAASRDSIVELDRKYLTAGHADVVERAIDLAVLLNEPPLIARLTKIAHARTEKEAGLSLSDPDSLPRVAGKARDALVKINGSEKLRGDEALLQDLRSSDAHVANDAAAEILSAAPARRTPAVVSALTAAMPRLMKITRVEDDRGAGECGFKCDLMALAVKADDPALIPVLVKGLEVGAPIQWLVKQGDAAALPLVDEALQNPDPGYLSSALLAFRLMLERNMTLSATSRAGIASVTARQLSSRYPNLVSNAIEIAALLGDPTLMPRLREIADARTMREAKLNLLGGDAAVTFTKLSSAASKALLRMR